MAEDKENIDQKNTGGGASINNSFNKGMLKDYNESFIGTGFYTHARNAVNSSHDGQVGVIGNEPSNLHCVNLPYDLIGAIPTIDDIWVIYTTNDVDSEIGLFDESACSYTKIINSKCLNFKRTYLITGTFRERYDCQRVVYWDDGLNPTRSLNIDDIPFKYTQKVVNGCIERKYTDELDCEAIRIATLVTHPCIKLTKGNIAGTLPNGSYQACIAYTVNQVKVTDYIGLSEVQSVFTHQNVSSSLELIIESIDKTFEEFELVILANINAQTVAKRIGYYSTVQGKIYIDRWDTEFPTVSISEIVLRTEPTEKSDAMYSVSNYLLRVGTYSKYKFNYQPLANQIKTNWVAVEYPASYYHNGGNNTSYLRDEQYAFFIRWIYNTGDRSESYHIPGRAPATDDRDIVITPDAFETLDGVQMRRWQVENTATVDSFIQSNLRDGGKVIARGKMGYWESTELYPANRLDIWGNLCGKPIRHHKMPDITVDPILNHFSNDGNSIVLLGVEFNNIKFPVDENGNKIESIIGYEILRGSREGNKSILGKGILNNMREYSVPGSPDVVGLYQNYPYNDLRVDPYLTYKEQTGENASNSGNVTTPGLSKYRQDVFSFHSPEVTFSNPFLNVNELKIYQEVYGQSIGRFEIPYKHPKLKFVTNFLNILLKVIGAAVAAASAAGAALGDRSLTLDSDKDIPLVNDLLTKYRTNFGIGTPPVPNPAIVGQNNIIRGLNIAVSVAMTPLTANTTAEQLYKIVIGIIPKQQYAAQYISHGFYNQSIPNTTIGNIRKKIEDANYVNNSIQQFTGNFRINNLNRSKTLVLKTVDDVQNPQTSDNSRFTIGESRIALYTNTTRQISSHYGALKLSIPSQYGQLESIKQLVITDCVQPVKSSETFRYTTPVLFNGDTYINRYTEKNSMLFFTDWLLGEPDNTEYNYCLYSSLPYPRFWVNSDSLGGGLFSLASQRRALDAKPKEGTFYVRPGYFYLFNSGVRDFFVESEINVAYRDWEDEVSKRHYDPYQFTDLSAMFRSDVVRSGNYYKYDYSLSVAKLFNSSISWGNMLPRNYDPVTAATCFKYSPNRLIYSLPQQEESEKDNWRIFLVNNYQDFQTRVTAIKAINKTGALFMMYSQSPLMFMGTEELKLDGTGAKVTVGDGGLFTDTRQLQSIVNTDQSYEYGSCQNRYSVVGTSHGVFWANQNQGKIFQYGGQLKEISANGLKWWLAKYLPSYILTKYPEYPLFDNPLKGVGVQLIYDNVYDILYITKKDYKPLKDLTYDEEGNFYYNNVQVSFNDPDYFENASFTLSYDCKSEMWISYHDWIPTFLLPSKTHFMSVNRNSIWKHNVLCDSYCNYYGVDYPFEVEFVSATGQQVASMRSIEYLLEVYKYFNDCRDRFHVLDQNFDQAMIYNTEQHSGMLNLTIKQKGNPLNLLAYPKITGTGIDIQFSKEENKYRFNQFWDVTKDRGEFSGNSIPMFITEANGYVYNINTDYVDYSKSPIERKKFRHYVNRVFLRKTLSKEYKFLFKTSNEKLLQSFR